MGSKHPFSLFVVVVLLLVAGGLMMWFIQQLTRDLGQSAVPKPAIAPIKAGATASGGAAPVVEVSAIRSALEKSDWAGLKSQLSKGVDVNAQMALVENTRRQMPLLTYAAMQGSTEGVKQLLEMGADPDVADSSGTTPLMMAAVKGDGPMIETLLEKKARVDTRNRWGQTALMNAAQAGSVENIKLLLKAGASPNVADEEGNTALHKAAGSDGPTDAVVLLLNTGAKPELKDRDGRRALEWAQQRNDDAGNRVVGVLGGAGK
jgi:hypothetical protein